MEQFEAVIVGGGQAGLAASHQLTQLGVEHIVLERGRIGQTWRDRWDSFCLVSPNWTIQLPGGPYAGDDPDGFMPREEIVAHLEGYQQAFGLPVREGVGAMSIESDADGFHLRTSAGDLQARSLVLASGAYQRPYRPPASATLPSDLLQIDVDDYRNEGSLPPGRILVIGSGQSGCQIAEELREAGREAVLSCGKAPWVPRRVGGRDIFHWFVDTGFMAHTPDSLSSPAARLASNPLATGHGGGHDLDLRILRAKGVVLVGHFLGASDHRARFAVDLGESVAWGDERYGQMMDGIRKAAVELGYPDPEIAEPKPFDPESPEHVSLEDLGAVIFAGGFRPSYQSWLPWPAAFDDMGFPIQTEGASTVVDGLYFVGVHWMRQRKSALLLGVGEDAAIVARAISEKG
ncbi:MAG: NAD(P)-binding domain-containing protein [Chloroflexi bacterium]|nr:NAD(P)-binding domain-containing protein [Chloroflexota bacterium]